MSLSLFKVLPKNPNGRGGCACSPHAKRADCTGPFVVFHATEAWDPRNPSIVIGYKCLTSAVRKSERTNQGKGAKAEFLATDEGIPFREAAAELPPEDSAPISTLPSLDVDILDSAIAQLRILRGAEDL